MCSFASIRRRLVVLGFTVAAAILSLWLAWALMPNNPLLASFCLLIAFGWAASAGASLVAVIRALASFCAHATAVKMYDSPCSTLKIAIGGSVPVVVSLLVISVWGAFFPSSAANLHVPLVFVTTASIMITAATFYSSILLSKCDWSEAGSGHLESIEVNTISEGSLKGSE